MKPTVEQLMEAGKSIFGDLIPDEQMRQYAEEFLAQDAMTAEQEAAARKDLITREEFIALAREMQPDLSDEEREAITDSYFAGESPAQSVQRIIDLRANRAWSTLSPARKADILYARYRFPGLDAYAIRDLLPGLDKVREAMKREGRSCDCTECRLHAHMEAHLTAHPDTTVEQARDYAAAFMATENLLAAGYSPN